MINSIQKLLELYAVIFQVFGQVLITVSGLLTKLVPVYVKMLTTVKDSPKYSHLWVRINRIRDLVLEASSEVVLLSKEFQVAIEDENNAEDFKDFTEFSKESAEMVNNLSKAFEPVEAKAKEYGAANASSQEEFKAWVKGSDKYLAFEEALEGPVTEISSKELFRILAEEFNTGDAVELIKDHLESGGNPGEISSMLNNALSEREQYLVVRMVKSIKMTGSFTYKYRGVRFVVSSLEE